MRVVVLGPGAAGKSTFARSLAEATEVKLVELDTVFWSPDLQPMAPDAWSELQEQLVAGEAWILEGDLGPYDVVDVRLNRADTVVLFDPPTWLCVWRTLRRSRQRLDYWHWLLTWRGRYLPQLKRQIADHPNLRVLVIRDRQDLERARSILVGANETGLE